MFTVLHQIMKQSKEIRKEYQKLNLLSTNIIEIE